jgi:FkbM family methyltransferase
VPGDDTLATDPLGTTQPSSDADEARVQTEGHFAKQEFGLLIHRLRNLPLVARAKLQATFANQLVTETLTVETPRGPLSFVLLGREAGVRALSVLTQQPATIDWIDGFRANSVFWDIGANIGVYTLYAGLRRDTKVVAFEPAAINYFLLSANVEANKLEDSVDCLLVGLSKERAIGHLEVSQFDPARSFSFRGKAHRPFPGRQAALLISMDQLVEDYGLACPNYLKVDVPGLAESIIAGGMRLLQRRELREIHIECSEERSTGQRIIKMLLSAGFTMADRAHHGGTTDLTFTRDERQA